MVSGDSFSDCTVPDNLMIAIQVQDSIEDWGLYPREEDMFMQAIYGKFPDPEMVRSVYWIVKGRNPEFMGYKGPVLLLPAPESE